MWNRVYYNLRSTSKYKHGVQRIWATFSARSSSMASMGLFGDKHWSFLALDRVFFGHRQARKYMSA